jgi:hypothetical protein
VGTVSIFVALLYWGHLFMYTLAGTALFRVLRLEGRSLEHSILVALVWPIGAWKIAVHGIGHRCEACEGLGCAECGGSGEVP